MMRKLQSQKDRTYEKEYRQRLKRMGAVIGGGIVLWFLITAMLFLIWKEKTVQPGRENGATGPVWESAETGPPMEQETESNPGMTREGPSDEPGTGAEGQPDQGAEGNENADQETIPGAEPEDGTQASSQETIPPGRKTETGEMMEIMVPIKIDGNLQETGLKVLSETETAMVSLWDILNRFGYSVSVTKDQACCTCVSQDQGEYNYIVVDYDGTVTIMEFDTGASGSRTLRLATAPLITDGEMYVKAAEVSNLIPQKVKRVLTGSGEALEFCSPSYVRKLEDERRRREQAARKAAEESRKAEEAAEESRKAEEESGKEAEESRKAEESGKAADGPGKAAEKTDKTAREAGGPAVAAEGTAAPSSMQAE